MVRVIEVVKFRTATSMVRAGYGMGSSVFALRPSEEPQYGAREGPDGNAESINWVTYTE